MIDANIFSGVYRPANGEGGIGSSDRGGEYPTIIVTVRPCYWSLPFSLTTYGCLLGKPGFTFGFLCVYVAWSRL